MMRRTKSFKYFGIFWYQMNKQVNIRLPHHILEAAETYAAKHGHKNIQEFIMQALREKLFEQKPIQKRAGSEFFSDV